MTKQPKKQDEIDIISAALDGDKQTVLKHQLAQINRDILENIFLELAQRYSLHKEIDELRKQFIALEPAEAQPDDPAKRKDRLKLQEQLLAETKEERAVELKTQDANAALKREEREKQGELLGNELKGKRLRDFDA
jgi:hypothetical protein